MIKGREYLTEQAASIVVKLKEAEEDHNTSKNVTYMKD